MLYFGRWNNYLQMKSHSMENKVTVTDTATRSLAEVGTGCARCCQDIWGRQDMTSLLSCGGAIKIFKNGRVREGEGHLERGIGEGQMFSCHCKPTCGWQATFQKKNPEWSHHVTGLKITLWRKRDKLHSTLPLEKNLMAQKNWEIQENK